MDVPIALVPITIGKSVDIIIIIDSIRAFPTVHVHRCADSSFSRMLIEDFYLCLFRDFAWVGHNGYL